MTGTNLRVRAASFIAVAGLVVTSCGGSTATPSASAPSAAPSGSTPAAESQAAQSTAPSASAATAQTGGTLYLLMTTATRGADHFQDLDPQRAYTGEDMAFFNATITQSLTSYTYSPDDATASKLVADAATDTGTANADATQWTFTLRDGLKWQDGSPVKCQDYAYGISRTFATDVITDGPTYAIQYLDIPTNADGSSKYPGPYKATKDEQALFDKAVVCNGNQITFHLDKGIGDFNYAVTLGMEAVPNPTDHPGVDTGENYTTKPWSDGPYMIQSNTPGNGGSLVLVRNPYWSSAADGGYRGAYPDKWVVLYGLDPAVVDQRLMNPSGDDVYALQYGNIQPENFNTIFTDPKTAAPDYTGRAFSFYDPYSSYLWIRVDKVPNVKIRQAMAVALDRQSILKNAGGDFAGVLGDGVIKPNIGADYAPTGWATDLFGQAVPPGGDANFAKQLIAESGEAAPTLTYDYSSSPVSDRSAAIIQSSLQAAGFTINLNPITSGYYGTVFDDKRAHEFGSSGWGPDWPNASTVIPPLFTPNGGFDLSRVKDPAWIAKVNTALADTNRADQSTKWQDLNKEAMQQVYAIPTLFGLTQTIAGTQVGGLYRWAPYGSWDYAQVYAKSQ